MERKGRREKARLRIRGKVKGTEGENRRNVTKKRRKVNRRERERTRGETKNKESKGGKLRGKMGMGMGKKWFNEYRSRRSGCL